MSVDRAVCKPIGLKVHSSLSPFQTYRDLNGMIYYQTEPPVKLSTWETGLGPGTDCTESKILFNMHRVLLKHSHDVGGRDWTTAYHRDVFPIVNGQARQTFLVPVNLIY